MNPRALELLGPRVPSQRAGAALFLLIVLVAVLCACGTEGNPPPLGKTARATLTPVSGTRFGATQASALLAPMAALHVTVYYRGKKLPAIGAQMPAELRQNSCFGSLVAPLTLPGSPSSSGTAGASALARYTPNPAGGMDVLAAPSGNLFVVVHADQSESTAGYLACGAPLSGRNQYFDLYPPQTGNAGIALGTALMSPIDATTVTFTITRGPFTPTDWAIRTGSCSGPMLAGGPITRISTSPAGVIFQPVGARSWWVTLTEPGGGTLCGPVVA